MKARTLVLVLVGLVGLALLSLVLGGFLFAGWFSVEPAAQQVAMQPALETRATVDAATAPAQAVPSPTPTTIADESIPPAATYRDTYQDEVAGFALDYPAGWHVVDVAPQIKASANNYTVSFLSWQPDVAGTEGIPDEGTKVDVSALPGPVANLQEAAAEWKEQMATDPGQTFHSETSMITAGGLQAVRWTVQSTFGQTVAIMTVIDGRPILLSGQGDEAILESIVNTLRPSG